MPAPAEENAALADPPDISIIILAKNEEENLERGLAAIAEQELDRPFEVLVIDSGSTDRTRDVARRFGARVHEIPPDEFQHGRTRNLGVRLARGRLLVFLVADACPASREWLRRMVEPLDDPSVGGVYGRQLPRPDTIPPQAFAIGYHYGPHSERRSAGGGPVAFRDAQFSDVSSAFRRDILERFPFPEHLIMCEDRGIAKILLERGFDIYYQAAAAVYHAHNYTLSQVFRRYFDIGVSFTEIWNEHDRPAEQGGGRPFGSVIGESLPYLRAQLAALARQRHWRWIPAAPFYDGARFAGYFLGSRHRLLPRGLRKKCSMYRGFWNLSPQRPPI